MSRVTDPRVEKVHKGIYEVTTTRQGWFNTASYRVEVRVVNRETLRTVIAINETQSESPRSVCQRAMQLIQESSD